MKGNCVYYLFLLFQNFTGNTDQDTVVSHDLNPPIRARLIRFVPVAWHSRISMRVELYGCQGSIAFQIYTNKFMNLFTALRANN